MDFIKRLKKINLKNQKYGDDRLTYEQYDKQYMQQLLTQLDEDKYDPKGESSVEFVFKNLVVYNNIMQMMTYEQFKVDAQQLLDKFLELFRKERDSVGAAEDELLNQQQVMRIREPTEEQKQRIAESIRRQFGGEEQESVVENMEVEDVPDDIEEEYMVIDDEGNQEDFIQLNEQEERKKIQPIKQSKQKVDDIYEYYAYKKPRKNVKIDMNYKKAEGYYTTGGVSKSFVEKMPLQERNLQMVPEIELYNKYKDLQDYRKRKAEISKQFKRVRREDGENEVDTFNVGSRVKAYQQDFKFLQQNFDNQNSRRVRYYEPQQGDMSQEGVNLCRRIGNDEEIRSIELDYSKWNFITRILLEFEPARLMLMDGDYNAEQRMNAFRGLAQNVGQMQLLMSNEREDFVKNHQVGYINAQKDESFDAGVALWKATRFLTVQQENQYFNMFHVQGNLTNMQKTYTRTLRDFFFWFFQEKLTDVKQQMKLQFQRNTSLNDYQEKDQLAMNLGVEQDILKLQSSGRGGDAEKIYRQEIFRLFGTDFSVDYMVSRLGASKLFVMKLMKCMAFLHQYLISREESEFTVVANFIQRMFLPLRAVDVSGDWVDQEKKDYQRPLMAASAVNLSLLSQDIFRRIQQPKLGENEQKVMERVVNQMNGCVAIAPTKAAQIKIKPEEKQNFMKADKVDGWRSHTFFSDEGGSIFFKGNYDVNVTNNQGVQVMRPYLGGQDFKDNFEYYQKQKSTNKLFLPLVLGQMKENARKQGDGSGKGIFEMVHNIYILVKIYQAKSLNFQYLKIQTSMDWNYEKGKTLKQNLQKVKDRIFEDLFQKMGQEIERYEREGNIKQDSEENKKKKKKKLEDDDREVQFDLFSASIVAIQVNSIPKVAEAFAYNDDNNLDDMEESFSINEIERAKEQSVYIESKCDDFTDFPQFGCIQKVLYYVNCITSNENYTLEGFLKYVVDNVQLIDRIHSTVGLVRFIRRNFKQLRVQLWVPAAQYIGKVAQDSRPIFYLASSFGHVWPAKKVIVDRVLKEDLPKKNQGRKMPYYIPFPDYKFHFFNQQFVYFDIESAVRGQQSAQNRKARYIHVPILLCAKFCVSYFGIQFDEMRSYQGTDCLVKFLTDLSELQDLLKEHGKQIIDEENDPEQKKILKRRSDFKIVVLAHNAHRYDDIFILPLLHQMFPTKVSVAGAAGNLKFIRVMQMDFRDTYELMPQSLKQLAKDLKTEHQKSEPVLLKKRKNGKGFKEKKIQFSEITEESWRRNLQLRNAVTKYCKMDVLVLYEVYQKFCQSVREAIPQNQRDQFSQLDIKGTVSSTALHIFQKYFMKNVRIYGNGQNSEGVQTQLMERMSYYGGYTQVFRHGKTDCQQTKMIYLDIVSMYPSILKNVEMPIFIGKHTRGVYTKKQDARNLNFIDCRLYQIITFRFNSKSKITNLPVRSVHSKETIYPIQFKSGDAAVEFLMVWGCELNLAKQLGLEELTIGSTVVYDEGKKVFGDYIEHFFKIKAESEKKPALRYIAKLFMNSLYGKFGQNIQEERSYLTWDEVIAVGFNHIKENFKQQGDELFNQLEKVFPWRVDRQRGIKGVFKVNNDVAEVVYEKNCIDQDNPGSMVRIASYVTACARCKLISALNKVGINDVYYCDTDSIVCTYEGSKKIKNLQGDKLGQFKVEYSQDEIVECDFISAKCYYLKLKKKDGKQYDLVKFKGVKEASVDMLQQIRTTGTCKKLQQQWRRSWGQILTEDFYKVSQLHTKRVVKINGQTRPFENFKQFEDLRNKILIYKNNKFIYI